MHSTCAPFACTVFYLVDVQTAVNYKGGLCFNDISDNIAFVLSSHCSLFFACAKQEKKRQTRYQKKKKETKKRQKREK